MGIHEVISVTLLSSCRTHLSEVTIQTQLHPDALVSALYSILDACFAAGHVLLKSLCSFVCASKVLTLRDLIYHLLVL